MLNPAQARIAQSNCIKPDHVTGAHLVPPYEDIIKLISQLDPSIETVGTIFNSSETSGATLGVGVYLHVRQGLYVGRVLAAYLNGDLDIASTGLGALSNSILSLNLDVAALQGIEIPDELRSSADIVIEDNVATMSPAARAMISPRPIELPEQAIVDDAEFLLSLQCTAEMIAEQQAALDAVDA